MLVTIHMWDCVSNAFMQCALNTQAYKEICSCGKEHLRRCLKHSKALMQVKMLMIPVCILLDRNLLLELKLVVNL